MRIAKWTKERGIKTHYYISPHNGLAEENDCRYQTWRRQEYVCYSAIRNFYEDKHL
jgi:lipid-A-disaccharide synthase